MDTISSLCYHFQTRRFYYKYNCHSKFTFLLSTNYNLQCGAHLSYNGVSLYWISFLSKQQRYCATTFKLTDFNYYKYNCNTNSHISFQQIITSNKIFWNLYCYFFAKTSFFCMLQEIGMPYAFTYSHPTKEIQITHTRVPILRGWSSSFQVSCYTHTHTYTHYWFVVFFPILFTLKSQSLMVLPFFKF